MADSMLRAPAVRRAPAAEAEAATWTAVGWAARARELAAWEPLTPEWAAWEPLAPEWAVADWEVPGWEAVQ